MDLAVFTLSAAAATLAARWYGRRPQRLYYVTSENEETSSVGVAHQNSELWHRATYILVMQDPPDMFYEPKEWSHTAVLLIKLRDTEGNESLALPCGPLWANESHVDCGVRLLHEKIGVDVLQPENCLHHLFTFPYDDAGKVKQWADFMECVFRGSLEDLHDQGKDFVRMSLDELKESVTESPEMFEEDSYYAIRLYFQRQMDLRAKRRLLKGYSSIDMERYGLRSDSKPIIFKPDEDDSERGDALDYTMKTDDGMSPRLLLKADVVLLGVSRVGKTPMSLVLSQTKGMRVANIPLVLEIDPPRQLFQVDARKVFLITQDAKHLEQVRRERLRREIKKRVGSRSTYADPDYVRRDLEKARELARDQGYTIIDITNRAMEEAASLIMSKIKERFPDKDFGDTSM